MEKREQPAWRTKAHAALSAYFRRRSLTPLTLGLFVGLTGLCGFLISFGLLHLGVYSMAIRYPLAVLGAYGAFLGFLRGWVEWEQRGFDPDNAEFQEAVRDAHPPGERPADRTRSSSGKWSGWLDGLDLPTDMLAEGPEGCLGLVILLALLGFVILLISYLAKTPALIEEGFLDTFLVVGLYRRLRIAAREHWLGTTIRKTWKTVGLVAAALAFLGFCLQYHAPEARSIGPAIRHLLNSNP
jgi:hypothetical protein